MPNEVRRAKGECGKLRVRIMPRFGTDKKCVPYISKTVYSDMLCYKTYANLNLNQSCPGLLVKSSQVRKHQTEQV
jgi:hypothetical protein